jgi:ribosome maturation factor RimP
MNLDLDVVLSRAAQAAEEAVRPLVEDLGFHLLDVEHKPGRGGSLLRLVVDRPEGLSVDDCAAISRRAEDLIDVYLNLDGPYQLEVTSPGLTRRLRRRGEFDYFAGRRVKVVHPGLEASGGVVIGRLAGLEGDGLALDVGGRKMVIPLDEVKQVRLCPEGFE